jgi:hypothetical protein
MSDSRAIVDSLAAIAERGERISRLAGLRDEQSRTALVERTLAVTKFRGDIDVDGKPRPALKPIFGDEAGIVRRAAGGDRQPPELGEIERQRGQLNRARGKIDIVRERVADDFGLLVNLFGHEMAVVALIDHERGRLRAASRPVHGVAVAVANGDAFAREHCPIAVLEIDDLVGEGCQRDGVGADEHLAFADADSERTALPRHDHQIIIAAKDHGDRKGAFEAFQRVVDGADGIIAGFHLAADEMGDDLGVGVAGEVGAFGAQLLFQLAEILDDAVMDNRDILGHVRVGIGLGGLAVRGPAGMANADLAEQRRRLEPGFEIA